MVKPKAKVRLSIMKSQSLVQHYQHLAYLRNDTDQGQEPILFGSSLTGQGHWSLTHYRLSVGQELWGRHEKEQLGSDRK